VFSAYGQFFPAKAAISALETGCCCHFASNKYLVPSSEKAPSICSPVSLKEAFGIEIGKPQRRHTLFFKFQSLRGSNSELRTKAANRS